MRITERRLRRLIQNVIAENHMITYGFDNIFSLTSEEARGLLKSPALCGIIENMSLEKPLEKRKAVIITNSNIKVPYTMRGHEWNKTHFVVLECDNTKPDEKAQWRIMWRYAEDQNYNYGSDISKYKEGKITYAGLDIVNRVAVKDYIIKSGYQYSPDLERR